MTTPITGVPSTTATTGTAPTTAASAAATTAGSSSAGKSLLDPQAFLQLLVAQLQYQDPSNPVDTSSFMNQTAMLSQVQTMNTMGSTLAALVSAQQTQAATSLIGKTVSYVDGTGATATGTVNGATLGSTGASVRIATTSGTTTVALADIREVTAP